MMNRLELLRQLEDECVRLILEQADFSQQEIADSLGVSLGYVQSVAKRRRCQRKRGAMSLARRRNRLAHQQAV
jgi:predicted XRE-type DNA-binding protein